ncbi:MAG: phage minor head protein [Aeromonas sp.]
MKLTDSLKPFKRGNRPVRIRIGHTYPRRVEAGYSADLRKMVKAISEEIKQSVMPALKQELQARDFRMDSADVPRIPFIDNLVRYDEADVGLMTQPDPERLDGLADVLGLIRRLLSNLFPGQSLAEQYAVATYASNEKDIAKAVTSSLGIQVALPGGDTNLLNAWVIDNTSIIEDLQGTYLRRIQRSISDGFVKGLRYEEIAKQIQQDTDISWRRAKNIARDQVGTLNAMVTKERNAELGVDEFIWRTMRDERVRGNPGGRYPNARPSHYAREGQKYSWKAGANGEFPGTPILCRCYAESVIEI